MSKRRNTREKQPIQARMTIEQVGEFFSLIEDGMPEKEARGRLGVTKDQFETTIAVLDDFFSRFKLVKFILDEEFEAELYTKAMNGSVTAQIEYLRRLDRRRREEGEMI